MPANALQPPTARFDELLTRVHGEYREMPGLSLTLAQAQRLWALEHSTCVSLFEQLVAAGVLRKTARGRFVRVETSDRDVQRVSR